MSGFNIDAVDTFFGSITSTWGRIVAFFLTCWLSFAVTGASTLLVWDDFGFSLDTRGLQLWRLVPVDWCISLIYSCFVYGIGLIFFAYLAYCFYQVVYDDGSLLPSMCWLFIIQMGHTFLFVMLADQQWSEMGPFAFHHPMVFALPAMSFFTYKLAKASQRRERME